MSEETQSKIKFNSFFAGIGGFDLGLERSGFDPSFHCEINTFCHDVLKKHWPSVPLHTDITKVEPSTIPDADVWCGGFPCQDVSVARGSKGRDGLKGKNSGLFYRFAELIEEKKPKVLLIENVLGLLSSHNGQDFRIVLESLAEMGYAVSWRVMNSRYFGAPQSRPRVFICAALNNPKLSLSTLYEIEAGSRPGKQRQGFLNISECTKTGAKVAHVAYCLAATSGRHTGTDWSRTYVSYHSDVRRLTPNECEGIQGFPTDWTSISCTKTDKERDVDTARYQALGNAVAVPVIEWIGARLQHSLRQNMKTSKILSLPELNTAVRSYQDFSDKSLRIQKLSDLHLPTDQKTDKLKWQSGGFMYGDICFDIKAPEAPSTTIEKKLIDVIEKKRIEDRYFISANAAEGILRRVYSQNRTLFPPMHDALARLSKKKTAA